MTRIESPRGTTLARFVSVSYEMAVTVDLA